jgi:membrane-bound lytic murein transglycosylase B
VLQRIVIAVGTGLLLVACTGPPSATSPSATPSPQPAPSPSPVPSPSPPPSELELRIRAAAEWKAPSAQALTTRLVDGFQQLRAPGASPASVARGARLVQAGVNQLVVTPEWRVAVIATLPEADRGPVEANLAAGVELAELSEPADRLPHWRIIAPASPDQLRAYYREAEQTYGVPWQYLAAINLIETSMGRILGLSSTGAMGPMQFMPPTWAEYGQGDVNDPHDAILAAGRYLKASGAPKDMDGALFAYNRSMHYVRAVQAYAQQVAADPLAFIAYYNWQVFVPTTSGVALLPEGWAN